MENCTTYRNCGIAAAFDRLFPEDVDAEALYEFS